jgi:hypothetical protein
MKTLALLAAGAVLFLAPPPPRSTPLAATVALVAELPAGGTHAAILRRAEPRADVILLTRSSASVENLAAALALLADVRGRDGPTPARDAVLVLKSRTLARPLSATQRLRLEAHLARLRLARARTVAGVGSVPAIDLTVRTRSRDP